MRKRITYLIIYIVVRLNCYGQINLVPNPSFEDTVGGNCWVQMNIENPLSGGNIFTRNWCTYKYMTPDFYNYCANYFSGNPYPVSSSIPLSCYGYQYPRTGNSFTGVGLYSLNYLPDSVHIASELAVVKLKQPLKATTCYYGEMYYSFGNINAISINQLGMLFTQTTNTTMPFVFDNTSKYQIQADTNAFIGDTLNWVKISGYFVANGAEEYLTIGNIRDGGHVKKKFINTSFVTPCGISNPHAGTYVYLDDVSLYELPNHTGTQSYTLCAGDSLLLGDTVSLPVRYQWSLNGVVVDTTKNITIKNAGTYILQTKHCTTQTQTITIVVDDGCNPIPIVEPLIPNVFTPNGDNVNDTFQFTIKGIDNLQFSVYNRWGISLTPALSKGEGAISNTQKIMWDGRTTSGIECSAGIYFYVLEYTDANGELKKKNGYISLIR